jgi:hypothetical protein
MLHEGKFDLEPVIWKESENKKMKKVNWKVKMKQIEEI